MKHLKIYESFIKSKNGYYVNRSGTIVFYNNQINVVLIAYTDHLTDYHYYTLFNVELMKYWHLNADLEEFTYKTPEEYFQEEPDKMVEISDIILNGDLNQIGNSKYDNRNLKNLIINKWFKKIPKLKEAYNLKKGAEKYNI